MTTFSEPFYIGATTSSEVPSVFSVAIGGHPYLVDLDSTSTTYMGNQYHRQTIPLLRSQSDTSSVPAEHSINPEELWRRATETWHKGAGQDSYDRPDSDPARYRSSKGINPWDKWKLTLLPGTLQKRSSANTNLNLMSVGSRLYLTDGTAILFTTDITAGSPTFTSVTGLPGAAPTSIASDGFNVYSAHTASGIYKTDRGVSVSASYVTGTVTLVGYEKGRLFASNANILYYITAAGALPAASFTHSNSDFSFVGFAEGASCVYAAGFSGDKSEIYRIGIKQDGTGLDVPVISGELPDGEIIRSIKGYMGFVVLGTDYGFRFAEPDGNGNLTIGPLVRTGTSVRCFEPQDRFMWFGWTNYDGVSSGLGRIDASTFTASFVPAYASDLMATAQGAVLNVSTVFHGGREVRVFSVSGNGFWSEDVNRVASGTIDSGLITYNLPDPKILIWVDLRHANLAGSSHSAYISVDHEAFVLVGTHASQEAHDLSQSFPAGELRGETFELRQLLTRDTVDLTTGPTITRSTLRAYPAPPRGEIITVPVMLYEQVESRGLRRSMNPRAELDYLRGLAANPRLVSYQEGGVSVSVFVEEVSWNPRSETKDGTFWNGTCILKLKAMSSS